jgi:hypothetical protein
MPTLRERVKVPVALKEEIKGCAHDIIAMLFYLELREEDLPVFDGIALTCQGQIRCRLGPSNGSLRVLIARLNEVRAYFRLNFEQKPDCCYDVLVEEIKQGASYCQQIELKVTSFKESIDIKLGDLTNRTASISNCPYKLETLVKDQGLDLPFGSRLTAKRTKSYPVEYMKSVIYKP